jgi:hypothetical protein
MQELQANMRGIQWHPRVYLSAEKRAPYRLDKTTWFEDQPIYQCVQYEKIKDEWDAFSVSTEFTVRSDDISW